MTFNSSNLTDVCEFIEEKLHFCGNSITSPHDWDLTVDANIQELLNKHPNEVDKFRYVIKVLDYLDYIDLDTNTGIIKTVKLNGYRFIFKQLHNVIF